VFSCMAEDGTILSTEKYTWSQARMAWTLSALYNRFERRREFVVHARKTIDFLLDHARDDAGRFVYSTTRAGVPIEPATSIYSDCFVVYAIGEYCRAVPDEGLRRAADEILSRVTRRIEEPDFSETAPYVLPPGRRTHGVPMILTEVTGEDRYPRLVIEKFVRPARKVLVEFLSRDYEEIAGERGDIRESGACDRVDVVCDALGPAARRHGDDQASGGGDPMAPGGWMGRGVWRDLSGNRCQWRRAVSAAFRKEGLVAAYGGFVRLAAGGSADGRGMVHGLVLARA
jgi:hypothetical protein